VLVHKKITNDPRKVDRKASVFVRKHERDKYRAMGNAFVRRLREHGMPLLNEADAHGSLFEAYKVPPLHEHMLAWSRWFAGSMASPLLLLVCLPPPPPLSTQVSARLPAGPASLRCGIARRTVCSGGARALGDHG